MGLFNKIFRKKGISEEETAEMQKAKQLLIEKYQKKGTLLKPHKASAPLSFKESKFGGEPNLTGFDTYPRCDACNNPLNFVLQLYKADYPEHYFPTDKNLFQLFRCPNLDCPEAYSDKSDLKTLVYYFNVNKIENKKLLKPTLTPIDIDIEPPITECVLKPKNIQDFPNHSEEILSNDIKTFENKYGNDKLEDTHPLIGTKSNGYPSYEQYPEYPSCNCGKTKEFFFQLSSEDLEDGVTSPPSPNDWSAHGIMIGDVGNIYFYVCKSCGEKSIETNWDCG